MKAREICSVGELAAEVMALFNRTGRKWWFRGHALDTWALLPSVRRDYTAEQERYLTNDFQPRAAMRYANPPDKNDYAGWLALMQHYGLPTRLLDWSRSPLVAAYFATESCQRHSAGDPLGDACVWALAPSELNLAAGLEALLYPLSAKSLVKFLKPAIRRRSESQEVPVAAVPSETDLRMVMQQGAFTIHPSSRALTDIEGSDGFLTHFKIPVAAQRRIAVELEILGLRRGDLFPDLTNLAVELKAEHHGV